MSSAYYRNLWRSQGRCTNCGAQELKSKVLCQRCCDQLSKDQKKIRERRKDRGVCLRCAKRSIPGKLICEACLLYRAANNREKWKHRRSAGLCIYCGKQARLGKVGCETCAKKINDHSKWLKANGRCICCAAKRGRSEQLCDKCLARSMRKRQTDKRLVFEKYGGAYCKCCGETQFEFLELDHINGGGSKHREEVRKEMKTFSMYRWLKKHNYPPGFQVLCSNCNVGKYRSRGECPHKKREFKPYPFVA